MTLKNELDFSRRVPRRRSVQEDESYKKVEIAPKGAYASPQREPSGFFRGARVKPKKR